jgi:hypothetical protein
MEHNRSGVSMESHKHMTAFLTSALALNHTTEMTLRARTGSTQQDLGEQLEARSTPIRHWTIEQDEDQD